MKKFSTVFNQILQLLPQVEFDRVISEFKTDRYVKHFKTKALFVVHLFAQIRKKEALKFTVYTISKNRYLLLMSFLQLISMMLKSLK